MIICGDVGLVWEEGSGTDRWWQKWFEDKKFTTLFIDGNHENHDALQKYPIESWKGELPTEEEYEEALKNLCNAGWKVDYVLTHTAPGHILHKMGYLYNSNRLTNFLLQ